MTTTTDADVAPTAATLVPPSSVKPTAAAKRDAYSGRRDGSPTSKRRTKHSFKSAARPMDLDPLFRRLDPGSDPRVAHTVAQRRKAIAKGKNTVGYAEYVRRVPRHQRRPRCAETPDTPDVTLDISNNRFYGMVRAWRVNLHKYDPPELLHAMDGDASTAGQTGSDDGGVAPMEPVTPMREDASDGHTSPVVLTSDTPVTRSRLFETDSDSDDDLL